MYLPRCPKETGRTGHPCTGATRCVGEAHGAIRLGVPRATTFAPCPRSFGRSRTVYRHRAARASARLD